MRVAFLINAHANFKHLQRLVTALLDFRNIESSIFVHIDAKSIGSFVLSHPRVYVPAKRLPVYWGGFSQVQATLLLLRTAVFSGDFEYFCFITGQDYLVRSEQFLTDRLACGKNYINLVSMPAKTKPINRLTSYWFEHDRRRWSAAKFSWRSLEKIIELGGWRKRVSFLPYAGSQHFFLRADCVKYILSFCDQNPEFLSFHRTALCPDESFFQTIIGNSIFLETVSPSLVYANWGSQWSNFHFSESDLNLLKSQTVLSSDLYGKFAPCFARKFFDADREMIERV